MTLPRLEGFRFDFWFCAPRLEGLNWWLCLVLRASDLTFDSVCLVLRAWTDDCLVLRAWTDDCLVLRAWTNDCLVLRAYDFWLLYWWYRSSKVLALDGRAQLRGRKLIQGSEVLCLKVTLLFWKWIKVSNVDPVYRLCHLKRVVEVLR